ncbi:putative DNA-3-methyladenine glycosylase I [Rosa chinensis]|uniref:Putative DNA-3-methyladenine glycosylase I n=1 Tax=Rosa chinensis TaxID=74649 RepID=A0A2P6Q7M8_ROSCH|nr:probable GMP synthase [glutamine-hydrolyzing] [Rosa chinensis]PRQ30180.1 putative DNA-3-methyladenine glycosylase I [Rosa chinensis]
MCSSKPKLQQNPSVTPTTPKTNRRLVLQPTGNQFPSLEQKKFLKKTSHESLIPPPLLSPLPSPKTKPAISPPISPKLPSPRPPALKRGKDHNELNSSLEKVILTPKSTTKLTSSVKKSKRSSVAGAASAENVMKNISSLIVEAPGSIAAARREQVATMQEQRKLRIAHYGRTKSAKFEGKAVPLDTSSTNVEQRRCSFITPNSDPLYVAYHDQEWGVPVHDDNLLLELLLLTSAQVGSDWSSVLRKRQALREAFSGFDAEIVAKFNEKKITSVSADTGTDISLIRGVVDNAKRILEIKRETGSFNNYLWGFVNHKPISTQYKSCHKIPVKTSKSESISKAMVKKGFRFVGPTVIHSFMQAAGLTNDHLITCSRHQL